MKKPACFLTAVLAALLLGGCAAGTPQETSAPQETAVTQVDALPTPAGLNETTEKQEKEPEFPTAEPFIEDEDHIDLSANGSAAAYGLISGIAQAPADYAGKTLRLKGMYAVSSDDDGNRYLCCLVYDRNGCCMQGLNFIPAPEEEDVAADLSEGEKIMIEGVYGKNGKGYCVTGTRILRAKQSNEK